MAELIEIPYELRRNQEALVSHIVRAVRPVQAIYVYGSQVHGRTHQESDLDIALLMPRHETVSPNLLLQLRGDLEALAGLPVGVSVLDMDSQLVHCKEVVAFGVPIYVADPQAVAVFEMQTFSSYARFCEERQPIMQAYRSDELHG